MADTAAIVGQINSRLDKTDKLIDAYHLATKMGIDTINEKVSSRQPPVAVTQKSLSVKILYTKIPSRVFFKFVLSMIGAGGGYALAWFYGATLATKLGLTVAGLVAFSIPVVGVVAGALLGFFVASMFALALSPVVQTGCKKIPSSIFMPPSGGELTCDQREGSLSITDVHTDQRHHGMSIKLDGGDGPAEEVREKKGWFYSR